MDIKLDSNPFNIFDKGWALVTSGPIDKHNSMTISWGALGTLWNKPVVTIYIKPCRYTHDFIENNDLFVVSFFDEEYKKALGIMGTKSGRDVDKDQLSNLTPIKHQDVTIYKEASITLICKKIYQNDLDINNIPIQEINNHYNVEKAHTMYIGEVVEIINKRGA